MELVSIGIKPQSKHPYFSSSDNVFAEIDKDGDGIIYLAEFNEYFARARLPGRPRDVYDSEDTDRDGVISWREFTGPKGTADPAAPVSRKKSSSDGSDSSSVRIDLKKLEAIQVDVGWT